MLLHLDLDTTNSYKALGRLLKFYRMRTGYTLRDIASLTNVSHTLVSNIEQGKVKGSDETLKDLFHTLKLEFHDVSDIIDEFKSLYEQTLNFLFEYEYTRAKQTMKKLNDKEFVYMHSVLITDYALIKFLYKVLLGEPAESTYINLDVFRLMYKNFSDKQKQIYFIIEAVNSYNEGYFSDAIDYLRKASNLGDSTLEYLVKLYLVKCYVKTYHFMRMIKLGYEIIDFFEEKIIYLRAMEIRLAIARSYLLNRDYEESLLLLDRVYQFATNFHAIYLIEEAKLLLCSYYIFTEDYEMAKKYVYTSTSDDIMVTYLKVHLSMIDGDTEQARLIYNEYLKQSNRSEKDDIIIQVYLQEVGILKLTDEEYHERLLKIISYAEKGHDIEVVDASYNFLIRFYRKNRQYKKALEASTRALNIRRFGI